VIKSKLTKPNQNVSLQPTENNTNRKKNKAMSSRGVRASDARGQTSSILQRADKRQALPLFLFF
jgi:hypothetical protein